MQTGDLLLEGEDGGDAAVDGIGEARLGLVADGEHGVAAAGRGDVQQELGHITGAEHLVHGGELGRALLRSEVGREDAPAHALAPQELARAAGRAAAHGIRIAAVVRSPCRARARAPSPRVLAPRLGRARAARAASPRSPGRGGGGGGRGATPRPRRGRCAPAGRVFQAAHGGAFSTLGGGRRIGRTPAVGLRSRGMVVPALPAPIFYELVIFLPFLGARPGRGRAPRLIQILRGVARRAPAAEVLARRLARPRLELLAVAQERGLVAVLRVAMLLRLLLPVQVGVGRG